MLFFFARLMTCLNISSLVPNAKNGAEHAINNIELTHELGGKAGGTIVVDDGRPEPEDKEVDPMIDYAEYLTVDETDPDSFETFLSLRSIPEPTIPRCPAIYILADFSIIVLRLFTFFTCSIAAFF